jgi:hypothetical protein
VVKNAWQYISLTFLLLSMVLGEAVELKVLQFAVAACRQEVVDTGIYGY